MGVLGDIIGAAGGAIESTSDKLGVDEIGKFLDDAIEGTGELADDAGLDHITDDVLKPVWNNTLGPVLKNLEEDVWRPYISPALATAGQAAGGGWSGNTGWGNDSWLGRFPTTGDIGRYWDASKGDGTPGSGISPGRAWSETNPLVSIGRGLEAVGVNASSELGPLVNTDFDIRDPAQREAAFSSGFGMLTSGTIDAIARWYLDPIVLIAGGAAIGVRAVRKPQVKGAKDPAKVSEEDFAANLDEAVVSKRVDEVIAYYGRMDSDDARRVAMTRDPALRGSDELIDLLARAPSDDARRAVLRLGLDGRETSRVALGSIWAQGAEEARMLAARQGDLERELSFYDRMVGNPTNPLYQRTMLAQRDAAAARVETARIEAIAAERADDFAELAYQARGTLTYIPRVTASQRAEEAFDNIAGVSWFTYQPSKYNVPMRVLKSASGRRPGAVALDAPGNAIRQSRRQLGRAGHGLGRGIDPKEQDRLLADIQRASLGAPSGLKAAVEEAERAAVLHNASLYNIPTDVADAIWAQHKIRRNATPTLAGDSPAYSGAKDAKGRWLDTVGTGPERVRMPITNTQNANVHYLVDLDEITQVFARNRHILSDPNASTDIIGALRASSQNPTALPVRLKDGLEDALDDFNRYWKPLQLMRLGYVVRGPGEEYIRAAAVLGAMNQVALSARSARDSIKRGRPAALLRDVTGRGERAAARAELDRLAPLKAEGAQRGGLVDRLEALARAEADLAPRIEAARESYRVAAGANVGPRGYAVASPGATLTPGPRGTLFRLDEPAEVGAGQAAHTRVLLEPSDPRVYKPKNNEPDPGVAALRDFLTRDELVDLGAMSTPQTREFIRARYPNIKTERKTYAQLLAAYGAQAARARGYAAIYHTGDQGTAYLALTREATRKINTKAEDDALARLAAVRDRQLETAGVRAALTGERGRLSEWSAAMNEDYKKLIVTATKPSARAKDTAGRERKFAGTVTVSHNGVTAEAEDIYGGAFGPMTIDITSSAATVRTMTETHDKIAGKLRVSESDPLNITPIPPKGLTPTQIKLHRESYDKAWTRAVNDQINTDQIMRRILEGKSNDEVLDWLRTTPDGAAYRRKMESVRRENLAATVARARIQVEHYLPDDNLRDLALSGAAKADDLRAVYRAKDLPDSAMPTIHGPSLDEVTTGRGYSKVWASIVDRTFRYIATAPDDVLVRQPFSAGVYRRELQDQFERLRLGPADTVSPEAMTMISRRARQRTIAEVRNTMYNLADQANLAHVNRFVMPFYAAWQDSLQTWSRLWMEDPRRLARLYQLWEAPGRSVRAYTDDDGRRMVAVKMPGPLKGMFPEFDMPANVFKGLIFQGEYWYLPGVGSPVTVPVAAVVRERPDMEAMVRPLLPYGAGDDWTDQVIPAWAKRAKSLFSKEDDTDYAKALFRNAQTLMVDRDLGKNALSDSELRAEAIRRSDDLFRARIAANLLLPFPPGIRSPYQLYIDAYATFAEQYRADPNVFDGKDAQDHFLDTYGEEYFALTLAQTKSNVGFIAPTKEGYQQLDRFKDLISESPDLGALIAGDTNGEYSTAVAQWMLDNRIGPGDSRTVRTIRDPRTLLADAETQRGWDKYRQMDTAIDAALASRGLGSVSQRGAQDLRVIKSAVIDKIKEQFPLWAQDYGTLDRTLYDRRVISMEKLVDEPRLKERAGFNALAQYLSARRLIVASLAARDAGGGSSNLAAKVNTDLRMVFEAVTGKLRLGDLAFADIHTRYLSNDDLDTGGVL